MKPALFRDILFWSCVAYLAAASGACQGQSLQDCIDATCRIVAGDGGCGTGTVIADDGTNYRILTNAHVAGRNDSIVSVEFWKDGYASGPVRGHVAGSWLIDNEDRDMAIVAVPKSTLRLSITPIPLASPGTRVGTRTIFSVGCAGGNWPTAWRGHIIGSDRPNVVEFVPPPAGGRSGSSLFVPVDGEMRVAGLIAWRSDAEQCGIAMHLGAIHGTYNGRTLTGWHPNIKKPGRTWAPRHMIECPPGGCDPWQGGQPYQQPYQQQPQQPDPNNPWFGGKQILPNNNPSDGEALLPWREGIEKKIADLEAKCKRGRDGKDGADGKDGQDAEIDYTQIVIDYDSLAVKVLEKHTPTVNVDSLAAEVIKKLPPVRVEWETLSGQKLTQEKQLGEVIKFKSVEVGVK